MNNEASFPFNIDFEGSHYEGIVTPSGETDKFGMPVYFRIMIGDAFFAYLCCAESIWGRRDSTDTGDEGLIQEIGEFIKTHYQ